MIKLLFTIFISLLLTFSVGSVLAQTEQEIAQKYGIIFPIKELGNCTSVSECKTFCDNPQNHESCINFAKKHNLTTQQTNSTGTSSESEEEILKLAKAELGCSTYDACMAFCEKEENMERCMDFAAKHDLVGGSNAAQMKQVISTLKSTLGCSSMNSCMEVCNSGDNMQKCMEIFKQAGFPVEVNYAGQDSTDSPEVWCPKAGENCSWDGNQCTCYSPGDCGKYPGCTWTGKSCECSETPTSTYQQPTYQESPSASQQPPEVWCPKAGANCSWDGQQCTCGDQGSGSTSTTSTREIGPSGNQPNSTTPADNPYAVQGGETIYKSECLAASCRWSDNPNSCDCTGVGKDVQGVSTQPGLLQQLIDFMWEL